VDCGEGVAGGGGGGVAHGWFSVKIKGLPPERGDYGLFARHAQAYFVKNFTSSRFQNEADPGKRADRMPARVAKAYVITQAGPLKSHPKHKCRDVSWFQVIRI
jgi:hypothetical protein